MDDEADARVCVSVCCVCCVCGVVLQNAQTKESEATEELTAIDKRKNALQTKLGDAKESFKEYRAQQKKAVSIPQRCHFVAPALLLTMLVPDDETSVPSAPSWRSVSPPSRPSWSHYG